MKPAGFIPHAFTGCHIYAAVPAINHRYLQWNIICNMICIGKAIDKRIPKQNHMNLNTLASTTGGRERFAMHSQKPLRVQSPAIDHRYLQWNIICNMICIGKAIDKRIPKQNHMNLNTLASTTGGERGLQCIARNLTGSSPPP